MSIYSRQQPDRWGNIEIQQNRHVICSKAASRAKLELMLTKHLWNTDRNLLFIHHSPHSIKLVALPDMYTRKTDILPLLEEFHDQVLCEGEPHICACQIA